MKIKVCDVCGERINTDYYPDSPRSMPKYFCTKAKFVDGSKVRMEWCERCMSRFKIFLDKEKRQANESQVEEEKR